MTRCLDVPISSLFITCTCLVRNSKKTSFLSLPETWLHLFAELRQNPDLHHRGASASSRCGELDPIARGIADSHYTEPRDSFIENTHFMLQHIAEFHRHPFTAEALDPLVEEPRLVLIAVLILGCSNIAPRLTSPTSSHNTISHQTHAKYCMGLYYREG